MILGGSFTRPVAAAPGTPSTSTTICSAVSPAVSSEEGFPWTCPSIASATPAQRRGADRPVARPGRSLLRGAGRQRRLRLAAAGRRARAQRPAHLLARCGGGAGALQGQPVIRAVQGRHRLDQAIARYRRTDPAGTDGRQRRLGRRPGAPRALTPPMGYRAGVGSALARASRWNSVAEYWDHADEQIVLLIVDFGYQTEAALRKNAW